MFILYKTLILGFFFSAKLNFNSTNTEAKMELIILSPPDQSLSESMLEGGSVSLPRSAAYCLTWAPQQKSSAPQSSPSPYLLFLPLQCVILGFSYFSVRGSPGDLLKCRFWFSRSRGGARQSAFLTHFQLALQLLVQTRIWELELLECSAVSCLQAWNLTCFHKLGAK